MELIDFSNCQELEWNGYNGANGTKKCIIYNGKIYLLKIPKIDKYSNGAISEHISCQIFESIGIKTQKTLLGIYKNNEVVQRAVACEDFILNEKNKILDLKDFASYKNQIINSSENGYGTELEEIINTFNELEILDTVVLQEHFWNMFVVDALLGNFDRHNGNWGLLVNRKTGEVEMAPIFDCASCLYPQLSEEKMLEYMDNKEEIDKRIYVFPNSAIKVNGEKINYYEFINSLENIECNKAVQRITPKINMEKIQEIIDNTPDINDIRKKFYKMIIEERLEKIIEPAYNKLTSRRLTYIYTYRTEIKFILFSVHFYIQIF